MKQAMLKTAGAAALGVALAAAAAGSASAAGHGTSDRLPADLPLEKVAQTVEGAAALPSTRAANGLGGLNGTTGSALGKLSGLVEGTGATRTLPAAAGDPVQGVAAVSGPAGAVTAGALPGGVTAPTAGLPTAGLPSTGLPATGLPTGAVTGGLAG
ncbi:hypothetical protein GQS52_09855 [Streptomyces sp. SCUT-3]|uniref:hypothetical protein n=1 Tax=Streptomyces sp. SCUT-3 TaxID=2684469 RepID=UPI0015FAE63C|nr:hypothetical protein [Streptomyces sp. SCUT-3]QMV22036.1 hypothetical protein GQS52_09855 [Streptomyces sp. SCUT-3]